MKSTDAPGKQAVPFGTNGPRETITATTPSGSNQASYDQGFPPITMTLKSAGGLPPKGQDMNQILFEQSSFNRYFSAGGGYVYDSAFSTAVGGYPLSARIPNSTGTGFWFNTVEDNQSNPENSTSALTGWIPMGSYGVTSLTGLSSSSLTLTTLQASKERITLSGTLTANINLVVPAWIKKWDITNNCTGAFSVTVKTPSGTGVAVAAGTNMTVMGDGTNVVAYFSPGAQIGSPIVITSTGSYTPSSSAVKFVEVEIYAAGGGGAGVPAYTSSTAAIGGGASGGTWAKVRIPVSLLSSPTTVTVGVAGTAGVSGGGTGGTGGVSSFGALVSCPGGLGSGFSTSTSAINAGGADSPAAATISSSILTIATARGQSGLPGYLSNSNSGSPGIGGSSPLGAGGASISGSASGYGGGGAGARSTSSDPSAKAGGVGSQGVCIIREFA